MSWTSERKKANQRVIRQVDIPRLNFSSYNRLFIGVKNDYICHTALLFGDDQHRFLIYDTQGGTSGYRFPMNDEQYFMYYLGPIEHKRDLSRLLANLEHGWYNMIANNCRTFCSRALRYMFNYGFISESMLSMAQGIILREKIGDVLILVKALIGHAPPRHTSLVGFRGTQAFRTA